METSTWLLWALVFLIGIAFVGTAIAASIASARESREAEGVTYDPDPTKGLGSDVLGRRR